MSPQVQPTDHLWDVVVRITIEMKWNNQATLMIQSISLGIDFASPKI